MTASRLVAITVLLASFWSFIVTTTTSIREIHIVFDRVGAFWGRGLFDSRALMYGAPFAMFLRDAQGCLRPDESYLLVSGPPGSQGNDLVRFHLLPRTPRKFGQFRSRTPPAWIVRVGRDGDAPVIAKTSESLVSFLGDRPLGGGPEDERIPASIDLPPDGTVVGDEDLTVQGWCQELGGIPCPSILVTLNGQPQQVEAIRYARPDVEQVVSGIGSCARAGYRFQIDLSGLRPGNHTIEVYFAMADGRHRRLKRTFDR